jgi:hypothetical protein
MPFPTEEGLERRRQAALERARRSAFPTEEGLERRRQEALERARRSVMGNRLLNHILPGTERLPYYTCRWCRAEIKNTYFKYLKHRGVCAMME